MWDRKAECLAAFKLMASSNVVGESMGRSDGFALRIATTARGDARPHLALQQREEIVSLDLAVTEDCGKKAWPDEPAPLVLIAASAAADAAGVSPE